MSTTETMPAVPTMTWEVFEARLRALLAEPTAAAMRSEASAKFLHLMLAAMMVSFHKYGAVADAYPRKVNAIDSLKKRLDMYRKTGNTEYLVDVANFAMIEFMHPAHRKAFFRATDAIGSPGRVAQNRVFYEGEFVSQLTNAALVDKDEGPLYPGRATE